MKQKFLLRSAAFCAAVSLAAGVGHAQSSTGGASLTGSLGSTQPMAPSSTATLSPTSRPQTQRLSQIMGSTVKDDIGNTLGQINDFVINPASGRIEFAVISLNDHGGKLTAVPWQLIRPGADVTSCTIRTTKEKLETAQSFEASTWPDFNRQSTSQQIHSHFGIQSEQMNAPAPTTGDQNNSHYNRTSGINGGGNSSQPNSGNGTSSSPNNGSGANSGSTGAGPK